MMKFFLLLLFTLSSFANICLDINIPSTKDYDFLKIDSIKTHDATKISANVFIPKNLSKNKLKKVPAIIFGNSWLLDEHEYLAQAMAFAKEGYIVLSYSLRGWGCSEGVIDVIGPNDILDFKNIVSWLIENTQVDENKIGVMGISYGGGLALMMAARDSRVKVAVGMSAWGNLEEALYGNEVPRNFWGKLLIYTGKLIGSASDEVDILFKNLVNGENLEQVKHWAQVRSPVHYIDQVNKRKTPIMIANNFGDNLFQPNNVLNYFNKLKSPKKLILSQGTHASSELGGLFGVNNDPFKYAKIWMDYWLKGIDHQFIHAEDMLFEKDLSDDKEALKSTKLNKRYVTKYLKPEGVVFSGVLSDFPALFPEKDYLFLGNRDSFATTGIPVVSAIIDGHFKYPQIELIPGIVRKGGFVFKSQELDEELKIRGNIKANLSIASSRSTIQVSVYAYDVGPYNIAKLITHGTYAKRNIEKDKFYKVSFDLVTTAYDVKPGHEIVFVIDAHDPLYSDLLGRFTTQKFKYDYSSFIKLPY